MGIVYKAEDFKLKRPVALKFISPFLTRNKESNLRFIYEVQTASALDHQNIATIYEIDESDDGRMFIAMAYYKGDTLRNIISRGHLPVKDTINIGIQIAEGLSKAHRKGIIHKDIKPANIIIDEDNTVKIIDFGLSILLSTYKKIQHKGTMGTISYMSPEEIKGKIIDFRTDIWSLGVIIFEMLTSMRPFEGEYDQEIIYAILNEEPEPINKLRTGVPVKLEQIVMKMLSKTQNERYRNMWELLADLKQLTNKTSGYEIGILKPQGKSIQDQKRIQSIAVLPMANLSSDPEQEYFTDGMTDTLITALAKIRPLKVISRTSSMCYKKTTKLLSEIAEELNVDAIVEGSVLRVGEKVQITVQLIHAATDTHLWAESYEHDMKDVVIMQGKLVRSIANEIRLSLTQQEEKRISLIRPTNPETYDNYLKGCFHFYKLSPEHFEKALEYFYLALDKDPNYALAYTGIAKFWLGHSYWGVMRPVEVMPKAKTAVMKALQLDDTLEEAHDIFARIKYFFDWDWNIAEKEFKKAIKLNPNYAEVRLFYSALLRSMKRDREALQEVNQGLALDPINFFSKGFYVGHLLHKGQYDNAVRKLREILRTEPNFPMAHRYLWVCYHQKQMYGKALEEAKKYFVALGKIEISDLISLRYSEISYKEVMNLVAEELKKYSKKIYISPIWIARLYIYAQNYKSVLTWLNKAYEERDPLMVNLNVSRDWDCLRENKQFREILGKMNLIKFENKKKTYKVH